MKTEFEYFEQLKKDYPDTMSKEQFYKAAHISKATALFLLQSGLVACKDSGKQTRRYTIKTNDVIAYLQNRILYPQKYAAPDGWYQDGRVYIVYTVEDIMDALSCASQKAMKLLNELDDKCGLIERKRQGLGKPNLIYVKNFIAAPESKFWTFENRNSRISKIKR